MTRTVIHAAVNGFVLQVGAILGVVAGFLAYKQLMPKHPWGDGLPPEKLISCVALPC